MTVRLQIINMSIFIQSWFKVIRDLYISVITTT